jgi:hypothetical protein
MTTVEEMAELVSIRALVGEVQLTEQEDVVAWKWTRQGTYTSKSAYVVQMTGAYCSFDSMAIWKAKTEEKHRFFAWLLVQRKILTSDKLMVRNWPCEPETAEHLCLHCIFAQEAWLLIAQWSEGPIGIPTRGLSMEEWWNNAMLTVRPV